MFPKLLNIGCEGKIFYGCRLELEVNFTVASFYGYFEAEMEVGFWILGHNGDFDGKLDIGCSKVL